jgi:hypothetical protein
MKKAIVFVLILIATILLTSCTTQQRVVYRDCDCNTTTFGLGWGNNPYWSWNDWGWGYRNLYLYRTIPPYYVYPNRVQPHQPTRYERKTTIGERPSRTSTDNVYPNRPRLETRPTQQNSQPSRVQQRTTTPTNNQPTRSRVQNN